MRLVTFDDGRSARVGALLRDGSVFDITGGPDRGAASSVVAPHSASMVDLLGAWDETFPALRDLIDATERARADGDHRGVLGASAVQLLAPVPHPPRIRDYLTYEMHAQASGIPVPPAFSQMPVCYKGNPSTVVGPDAELAWPAYTDQLDFELELGFYVAGSGVDLSVDDAAGHIAGVTIFNDVSARDIQMVEMSMRIGPSKSKDFCNVMGPCMVTMDEIDEWAIELVARVNGEEWARGTSEHRRFSFAEVLAWASYGEPVVPGEFLAVGTVGGGCGLELDRWIQPGDVVELEASGIGVLRNTVGARTPVRPGPGLPSYPGSPRFTIPKPVGDASGKGSA